MVGVIWDVLKKVFGWMWENKNIAGYIILAIIIAFLTWKNNNLIKDKEKLVIEKEGLPENIEFIGELKGNKFKVTYKDSKGATIHKEYYVPSEGGVKFTKYIDLRKYDANSGFSGQTTSNTPSIPSLNPFNNLVNGLFGKNEEKKEGQLDTQVNIMGFTFRPGIHGFYSPYDADKPVNVGIDTKLIYISRASAGIGSTLYCPNIWLSYHVDQFVPFIPINNAEAMILIGKPYNDFGKTIFGVGLRSNL